VLSDIINRGHANGNQVALMAATALVVDFTLIFSSFDGPTQLRLLAESYFSGLWWRGMDRVQAGFAPLPIWPHAEH
jgi:hypothetical protein